MIFFRKNVILYLSLFIFSIPLSAQLTINGKVINEQSGLPIQGASIYFNGTSVGTNSNTAGEFFISSANTLNTELIVSCVGYETLVIKINAEEIKDKKLLFKLQVKEQQLREVLIMPDAVRKRWLAIFKENFLGLTEEASRSSIQNMKDIYFTKGEGRNEFKAYSDTPLVIVNKKLGYRINFELVDFSFDEESGRTYFYGYTRYEEMGDKNKWIKNRRHCYYGSTMHFYRSLIANDLNNQGYKIYLVKPVKISALAGADEKNNAAKPAISEEMTMAVTTTAEQIIHPDSSNSNTFIVTVNGKLMVQYDKDPASKKFLKDKIFLQGSLPTGFRSYVTVKTSFISVDKAGIVNNPMDLEYSGYWIYEKAANLLPLNYQPD
jgi:hypothetical protein